MHGLGFELLGSEFSWQCQVTLPSQREAGLKGPLGCQRVASAASDRPSGSRPTRPVQSSGALKHGFGCTLRRASMSLSEGRWPDMEHGRGEG